MYIHVSTYTHIHTQIYIYTHTHTDKTKIMASSPIASWQIEGEKVETVTGFIFSGSKIMVDSDCSHEIQTLAPWKKSHDKPRQYIKKQRYHFADKGLCGQSYGFSSSHVQI